MPSKPPTLTETNEGSRILFCHVCEFEWIGHSDEIGRPCINCDVQEGLITLKGVTIDKDQKKRVKQLRKKIWGV